VQTRIMGNTPTTSTTTNHTTNNIDNTRKLECGQSMTDNIMSSGGDTVNSQKCKFIMDNQSSNILESSAKPPPSRTEMSHLKMWNYTLLLLADNLVNVLIVVGFFIIVLVILVRK
jgi:hypothetical protein